MQLLLGLEACTGPWKSHLLLEFRLKGRIEPEMYEEVMAPKAFEHPKATAKAADPNSRRSKQKALAEEKRRDKEAAAAANQEPEEEPNREEPRWRLRRKTRDYKQLREERRASAWDDPDADAWEEEFKADLLEQAPPLDVQVPLVCVQAPEPEDESRDETERDTRCMDQLWDCMAAKELWSKGFDDLVMPPFVSDSMAGQMVKASSEELGRNCATPFFPYGRAILLCGVREAPS